MCSFNRTTLEGKDCLKQQWWIWEGARGLLILGKKKIAEGRKAGGASKKHPPPPLPLVGGLDPPLNRSIYIPCA